MKKISLKNIKNKQESRGFNTDLFKSDFEIKETLSRDDYYSLNLVDSQSSDYSLKERYLATHHDEAFMVTATKTSYNGNEQLTFGEQRLTLKGFNWLAKSLLVGEEFIPDFIVDYYDNILKENNFDFSYSDLIEMAEYNPQFNCSILSLEDENNDYYLTVNSDGLLSKITTKPKTTTKGLKGGLL